MGSVGRVEERVVSGASGVPPPVLGATRWQGVTGSRTASRMVLSERVEDRVKDGAAGGARGSVDRGS